MNQQTMMSQQHASVVNGQPLASGGKTIRAGSPQQAASEGLGHQGDNSSPFGKLDSAPGQSRVSQGGQGGGKGEKKKKGWVSKLKAMF